MRLLRHLCFYLFTVIYLVTCPLTILYALGYVLRPGAEHGMVKTGLISVTTTPPGATIYLGKRRYTKRTPTVLRDLLPGEYPIAVILKRYKPWVRTLRVEPEKATALEKLVLLPTTWTPREILRGAWKTLTLIPESRFLLLASGPTMAEVMVYDVKAEKTWPLLPSSAPWERAIIISQTVTQESPAVLFQIKAQDGEHMLWIELREDGNLVEELTASFPEPPYQVEWDPVDRHHVFVFHRGSLSRLDLVSKFVVRQFMDHLRGFGLLNRSIYGLTEDNVLERFNRHGKNPERVLDDPLAGPEVFSGHGLFQVLAFSPHAIFLLGDDGALVMNRPPYHVVDHGVKGLVWDPHHERVVVWQTDRLGVLDLSTDFIKDLTEDIEPTVHWIFTQGRYLEQAFWVAEGSHVLFRDQNHVYLLQLEPNGPASISPLLDIKRNSDIGYVDDSGTLYYLDHVTGRAAALQLLPKRELRLPFYESQEPSVMSSSESQ